MLRSVTKMSMSSDVLDTHSFIARGPVSSMSSFITGVSNDTPLLLKGKVDYATNTTNYLIPAVVDATGKDPGVLLGRDAGAPDVPIWIYAGNTGWLKDNADAASRFMGAIANATEWAIDRKITRLNSSHT